MREGGRRGRTDKKNAILEIGQGKEECEESEEEEKCVRVLCSEIKKTVYLPPARSCNCFLSLCQEG
jgi:hypothetical protein